MSEERWQELVERARGGPVTPGSMFGSRGLRTGKKFFALWWEERLVLKLPAGRIDELVAAGEGEPFEPMPGRGMNGWLLLTGTTDWDPLVAEARVHTEARQQ